MRIEFTANGFGDPERAVLPAIIYNTKQEPPIKVSGLAIGWWKYGLRATWTTVKPQRKGK